MSYLDVLALLVVPPWLIGSAIVQMARRIPKPPRAVFEIDRESFGVTQCNPASGEVTTARYPRPAVAEVRANRYEPKLWIRVPWRVKATYPADLPRETMDRIEVELAAALARAAASASAAGTDAQRI